MRDEGMARQTIAGVFDPIRAVYRRAAEDDPRITDPVGRIRLPMAKRKDIEIAVASAKEMGLDLPGLDCARALYDRVAEKGWDEMGTQVLYRLYTSL